MTRLAKVGAARDWSRIRLLGVGIFFALAWLALWGRAFHVQVWEGKKLAGMAARQHQVAEFVRGERGRILDRGGRELAVSLRAASVYARPVEVEHPERAARSLAAILGQPVPALRAKLESKGAFVWLARQLSDKEAAAIAALREPGVSLADEFRRFYPGGQLAGQVLGFVGADGEGLEGVEKAFDDDLSGLTTQQLVGRDASGRRLALSGESPEELAARLRGADIKLTLDAHIQSLAEQALAAAVTAHHGRWGGCLVADVRSGEILAMAQYPFFNPNVYREQTAAVWKNRILGDAMEPGSTLKCFAIAAALQEGVVTPNTEFNCEMGKWAVRGATIGDTHKYGVLPVHKILAYSSNIGAGKIGQELGAARLRDYLAKVGLGERSGLPLAENKGLLRPAKQWAPVDLVTASFGQGVSANMAQMARAFLVLADGGARKSLKLTLEPAPEAEPEVRVFSPKVAQSMLAMLREVVEEDGTGSKARIEGLDMGGKTGTAQKAGPKGGYGDKYLGSFVALVPALAPKLLVMINVDEPQDTHYGGVVAAPAVREVAVGALSFLGELPDTGLRAMAQAAKDKVSEIPGGADLVARELAFLAGAAQNPAEGAVPNLVGMPLRRAVEVLAGKGAMPQVQGAGVAVTRQQPGPGQPWPRDGKPVVLHLGGAHERG